MQDTSATISFDTIHSTWQHWDAEEQLQWLDKLYAETVRFQTEDELIAFIHFAKDIKQKPIYYLKLFNCYNIILRHHSSNQKIYIYSHEKYTPIYLHVFYSFCI